MEPSETRIEHTKRSRNSGLQKASNRSEGETFEIIHSENGSLFEDVVPKDTAAVEKKTISPQEEGHADPIAYCAANQTWPDNCPTTLQISTKCRPKTTLANGRGYRMHLRVAAGATRRVAEMGGSRAIY